MIDRIRWHKIRAEARAAAIDEANRAATGYRATEPAMEVLEMVVRDLVERVERLEQAAPRLAPITKPSAGAA